MASRPGRERWEGSEVDAPRLPACHESNHDQIAPMTATQLRETLANAPLTIELLSGRTLRVQHTDYALVSPTGDSLAVYSKAGGLSVVSIPNIEAIKPDRKKTPV